MPDGQALLEVSDLRIELKGSERSSAIVRDVSFDVHESEVLGVAGESGSGKTMSMLSLLGLLPRSCQVAGRALFQGEDLFGLTPSEIRDVRGRRIAMVFQDPMTSLHPMLTIERQLTDHLRQHLHVSKSDARARAVDLLEQVRIPDPQRALMSYPHHFSGGMRQRIAIAIALACSPKLLIADEPTTALDVTVQAGILRLLHELRSSSDMTVIMITHDLGVLSSLADRLLVFYAGSIVECGPTSAVVTAPRHPYTQGLLASLPNPDSAAEDPLVPIAGSPATPTDRPSGCAFHPRCPYAEPSCAEDEPKLQPVGPDRLSACPIDPLAP